VAKALKKPWWYLHHPSALPPIFAAAQAVVPPDELAYAQAHPATIEGTPKWHQKFVDTGQLPTQMPSPKIPAHLAAAWEAALANPLAAPAPALTPQHAPPAPPAPPPLRAPVTPPPPKKKPWWWGVDADTLPPALAARQQGVHLTQLLTAQAHPETIAAPPAWYTDQLAQGVHPTAMQIPGPPTAPPAPPHPPAGVSLMGPAHQNAWEALHAVADAARPGLQKVVLETWQQAQVEVPLSTLMSLASGGPGLSAAQEQQLRVAMESAIDTHFEPKVKAQLLHTFLAGYKTAAAQMPQTLQALVTETPASVTPTLDPKVHQRLTTDLMTPKALQWGQTHSAALVTSMTTQAREAIRLSVQQAMARGTPIGVLTTEIRGILETVPVIMPAMNATEAAWFEQSLQGLLPSQVKAMETFRQGLWRTKGMTEGKAQAAVTKKAAQYRRQRAEMIARTETITAAAAGQQALWEQAATQGLVDTSRARRRWVLTPDDKLCPTCLAIPALNPEGVGLTEPFKTPRGEVMHPAAHPRCRCAVALVFTPRAPLSLPELVTPILPPPSPVKPKPPKKPKVDPIAVAGAPAAPPDTPVAPPAAEAPPTQPGSGGMPPLTVAQPPPPHAPGATHPPAQQAPASPATSQTYTSQTPAPAWATTPPPDFWLSTPDVDVGPVPKAPGPLSTGIAVIEDGKVWIYEPKHHFGGYKAAFPKGKKEPTLTAQQNALKEVWEETGLQAEITGYLGDFVATTSTTRLYVGTKVGGDPTKFGGETWSVKLLTPEDLEAEFASQALTYPMKALQALKDKGLIAPGSGQPATVTATTTPASTTQAPGTTTGTGQPGALAPQPLMTIPEARTTFVRRLGGSTGAEQWTGVDGLDRVVKTSGSAFQYFNEGTANRAYEALGVGASRSTLLTEQVGSSQRLGGIGNLFEAGGQELGRGPVAQEAAREIFKGFVADVWLNNRDVAGLTGDNIKIIGGKVLRMDQGGALLFRATGPRKPSQWLESLTEWEGFQDPNTNEPYARVVAATGYTEAQKQAAWREQFQHLTALRARTNNFDRLVPRVAGVRESERQEVLTLMRTRYQLLEQQINRLGTSPAGASGKAAMIAKMGQAMYDRFLTQVRRRAGFGKYGLEEHEAVAINAYSDETPRDWVYKSMNPALYRGADPALTERMRPQNEAAASGLRKRPMYTGTTLWRGARKDPNFDQVFQNEYKINQEVVLDAFSSTSMHQPVAWDGFGGSSGGYRYTLTLVEPGGHDIRDLSEFGGEGEYLWPPGTRWMVTNLRREHNTWYIDMTQIPEGTPAGAPPARRTRKRKPAPPPP
jgi:8-oxo-dGTP pyrophosphatase MutT (NUDIX family)